MKFQFHHVYNLAMSEPITKSHEYIEAFQYLKMSERAGLIVILENFMASFKSSKGKIVILLHIEYRQFEKKPIFNDKLSILKSCKRLSIQVNAKVTNKPIKAQP